MAMVSPMQPTMPYQEKIGEVSAGFGHRQDDARGTEQVAQDFCECGEDGRREDDRAPPVPHRLLGRCEHRCVLPSDLVGTEHAERDRAGAYEHHGGDGDTAADGEKPREDERPRRRQPVECIANHRERHEEEEGVPSTISIADPPAGILVDAVEKVLARPEEPEPDRCDRRAEAERLADAPP
jgi:hypothetical protein